MISPHSYRTHLHVMVSQFITYNHPLPFTSTYVCLPLHHKYEIQSPFWTLTIHPNKHNIGDTSWQRNLKSGWLGGILRFRMDWLWLVGRPLPGDGFEVGGWSEGWLVMVVAAAKMMVWLEYGGLFPCALSLSLFTKKCRNESKPSCGHYNYLLLHFNTINCHWQFNPRSIDKRPQE